MGFEIFLESGSLLTRAKCASDFYTPRPILCCVRTGAHGSHRGGHLAIQAFYDALSLTSKETILGTFGCRGKVKSSILDALMNKAEHRSWVVEARSAEGHPDERDLADAASWAKAMIAKVLAE